MDFPDLAPIPASYLKCARLVQVRSTELNKQIRLAIVSTCTAEFLRPYIVVEAARRELLCQPWFAPWGQMEEQLLDPGSELYEQRPHAVLILSRLEELVPGLPERFLGLSVLNHHELIDSIRERFSRLLTQIRIHTTAPVLIANFAQPERNAAGLADSMRGALSQAQLLQQCNVTLAETAAQHPGIFVLDLARTAVEFGIERWRDPKLFYLARIPWTVGAQIAIGRELARHLRAVFLPAAKVLVLDLDNTLWGGVLGEDGIGGIALGTEYPGNVFQAFQKYLLTLKQRGVLLAIATKNNPAEVEEVWIRHPDCVLRREDFAAIRIGWEDKSQGIQAIAEELNVGLDSLVFFDDSAFERAEVKSQLPAVTVLDVPPSALGFIDAIEGSGLFDRLTLTVEDSRRASIYQAQAARADARLSCASKEEFLEGLGLVATIGEVTNDTLPRVAQLLARTNQFNLTTRRHQGPEITQMQEAGALALWLRLADRFGDHGLVGVAIAVPQTADEWWVDTFLLSCRVIGRGGESALLADLAARIADRGGRTLIGVHVPSGKNALTSEFYPAHGFCAREQEGVWHRSLESNLLAPPSFISVRRE